jgi:D-serine deaminase-like pyridoxal phosphate-dependent protein
VELKDIATAALVVDIAAMGAEHPPHGGFLSCVPCTLRPHFKAHKTPEIARRQLAAQ